VRAQINFAAVYRTAGGSGKRFEQIGIAVKVGGSDTVWRHILSLEELRRRPKHHHHSITLDVLSEPEKEKRPTVSPGEIQIVCLLRPSRPLAQGGNNVNAKLTRLQALRNYCYAYLSGARYKDKQVASLKPVNSQQCLSFQNGANGAWPNRCG
jgi:hypothetical protein